MSSSDSTKLLLSAEDLRAKRPMLIAPIPVRLIKPELGDDLEAVVASRCRSILASARCSKGSRDGNSVGRKTAGTKSGPFARRRDGKPDGEGGESCLDGMLPWFGGDDWRLRYCVW